MLLNRAHRLFLIVLVVLGMSLSCGRKDDESEGTPPAANTSAPAKPLTPGVTQNLTRSDAATLCVVDNIGLVSDPARQQTVQVPGDKTFGITGWAIDQSKKTVAGGVDVVIDQSPFSAHYGSPRKDVATHFSQPAYEASGFELMIAPGQLPKGQHSASIRIISNDRKSYYQGPVIQFAVM
jgi:hypothetical protein